MIKLTYYFTHSMNGLGLTQHTDRRVEGREFSRNERTSLTSVNLFNPLFVSNWLSLTSHSCAGFSLLAQLDKNSVSSSLRTKSLRAVSFRLELRGEKGAGATAWLELPQA